MPEKSLAEKWQASRVRIYKLKLALLLTIDEFATGNEGVTLAEINTALTMILSNNLDDEIKEELK